MTAATALAVGSIGAVVAAPPPQANCAYHLTAVIGPPGTRWWSTAKEADEGWWATITSHPNRRPGPLNLGSRPRWTKVVR